MNKYTDNKVYFIDGEEFGPEADVTITVVVNVLYGLDQPVSYFTITWKGTQEEYLDTNNVYLT